MRCYKAYLLGYAKSRSMLTSQARRNVHFTRFLERCRELTENPLTMEIGNLLIEPTQRIAKYPLLFKGNCLVRHGTRSGYMEQISDI